MSNAGKYWDRVPRQTFLGTVSALAATGAVSGLTGNESVLTGE
jgi:hypothetical protein